MDAFSTTGFPSAYIHMYITNGAKIVKVQTVKIFTKDDEYKVLEYCQGFV